MTTFKPGELFVYMRDNDANHMELGQVKEAVSEDSYACWYTTGDTAAVTNVRNMRKLANAGVSHIERKDGDDTCEWNLIHKGPMYSTYQCSQCLYKHVESNTDPYTTELDPHFCPNCRRVVINHTPEEN